MCQMPQVRSCLVSVLVLSSLCAIVVQTAPMTKTSIDSIRTSNLQNQASIEDTESLPPDTFRKLAQALYQRGDKVLDRKRFHNESVTCNDGSVAGYYIRRNRHSKRWIIFLEGGWICHDSNSCKRRERHLMSSNHWKTVKSEGGILSADPEENPYFADANHVFVPYCSSDSWSGTVSHPNEDGFTFMGRHIIREVIKQLSSDEGLRYASELFLAGSSAGATGVLVNADYVSEMMIPHGVRVRGIVDSGWFLDNTGNDVNSQLSFLQYGIQMWRSNVNDECASAYPNNLWKCFIGYRAQEYIKTPLFIIQWQFDSFQLMADQMVIPDSSLDKWNWQGIHNLGSKLRNSFKSLKPLNAVFSPACISHEVITNKDGLDWTQVVVDGTSLPSALSCWASGLRDASDVNLMPSIGSSGGKIIQENSNVAADSRQRPQKDDPEKTRRHGEFPKRRYKPVNTNMLRRLNGDSNLNSYPYRPGTGLYQPTETEKNKMDTRLGKFECKQSKGKKKNGNQTRQNSTKGGSRSRRRLERLQKKCEAGNQKACQKLCPESNRGNKDLIRSLDRRSSKNHKKKSKKSLRKQRRRLKRKCDGGKLNACKKLKRINKIKKNNSNQRKTRSTNSPTCKTVYIDECTWPNCNRSCPKLKNPTTGQNVDYFSLLKSFGSNPYDLAKVLGVNIDTLNNMDRDKRSKFLLEKLDLAPH